MSRPIDANVLAEKIESLYKFADGEKRQVYSEVLDLIAAAFTLEPFPQWVSERERKPELPDYDYCQRIVIVSFQGQKRSRAMIYERSIVRGKRVERWKYSWDKIADEIPDYWMPLPKPHGEEG